MRIRTQNLIAIVPVFLGMAAAAGAMTYSTARSEMLWGLQEESTSLGVAMAEFVDGDALEAATTPADHYDALAVPFRRILDHGQAKYIFALRPDGEPVWSIGEGDESRDVFIPPTDQLRLTDVSRDSLASGGAPISGPVTELASGESVMIAYAPISTSDGTLAGILGVVIDAARLPALSSNLLGGLARLTLVAVVIGTLASLFISFLLTTQVKTLSKAALEVAGGQYEREVHIGTIQEMSDLSNTFNTMSSVLKDLIDRTRRTLIEGEQFRTPLDLARTYRQDTWPDLGREFGGVHVASRTIGGGHPGDLFGVVEQEDQVTVFVGRVTESWELDSAVSAAAARHAIEEGTRHWPLPRVIDEVCRLLRIRIETVSWQPAAEGDALVTSYDGMGEPSAHPLRLDHDQTALLHTFPGRAGDVLQRWKRVFQNLSADALVDNLARTMESGEMGTLVAIGREPVGAEAAELF